MTFQPPARLPAGAAIVLAAGLMLTAASCSHLTPLGPDPAATMPQPHHLRSPLVLQDMRIQPPAPAAGCLAGYIALPGGASPGACYRKTGTPVTITSAGVSPVSSFRPPQPPGQQAGPIQYGFWITLPAADVPALAAVIPTAPGRAHRQGCHLSCRHSRRQRCRPHLGPHRLHDTAHRPGARGLPAQQESGSPASAHAGRTRLRRKTSWFISVARPAHANAGGSACTILPPAKPAATGAPGARPRARRHRSPASYGYCGPGDHLPDHRDAQLRRTRPGRPHDRVGGRTPGHPRRLA